MTDRRALWVLGATDFGGMGRHALDVASAGIPGVDVSFLVGPGPLADELTRRGAVIVAASDQFEDSAGMLDSLRALRAAIEETSAHIIHSHLARADFLCALLPRPGVLRVSTEHGIADVPRLYNRNPATATAKRMLHGIRLRRTAGVIAVSEATKRSIEHQWRPAAAMPLRVIYNGVDPVSAAHATSDHPMRLGILSRLSAEKRIDLVIEALAILNTEMPGTTLTIAGTGGESARLQRLAAERHLSDVITFVGHVDPTEFLEDIDLLVQVSAWENCSYSLLDAVAAGRPVVATAVGGNPEILPSPSLVAPSPTPAEIAQAILRSSDRPSSLPDGWPDVAAMTTAIATFYDDIAQKSP